MGNEVLAVIQLEGLLREWVCVQTCIYVYVHTACVQMCTHVYDYMEGNVCANVHACVHAHRVCVQMCVHAYVHIGVCVQTCMQM